MSRSLSDLASYVADAFRLAPAQPFVPENIVLGSYTFLPWVRDGVAAAVAAPADPNATRATIAVAVAVQADGQPDLPAGPATPLAVRGPGDVLGIDERQVIRCHPAPGTTNAEDSYLAHVEFDRPELPWLFTPAAPAGDRLAPWIALVVLAAGRYQLAPGAGGRPDQVTARKSELQPLDDSWAWAHAQLIGPAGSGPSVADRLTPAYAGVNLSRLVCPRHLAPDTQYLACVVPAYDAGVQAGLGTGTPGTLAPAWTRQADGGDGDDTVVLPVYASWRFGTGPAGDFESLAEKLAGLPAPWQVGRRVTDVSRPGGGLPELAPDATGRNQTVHGPLVSPNPPDAGSPDPAEAAAALAETSEWPAGETEALRTLLNAPDALAGRPPDADHQVPDRPLVGPEIYARHHAALSRVEPDRDADWFGQLNLRPEHRVVAGLGTRVVQKDQEQLMQAAWAQVGAIDEANRQLRRAQLARFVGTSSHTRHLAPLAYGSLLATTRRVQSRVLGEGAVTVAAAVADSNLADSAVTAAFRRVTRPLGGLARVSATRRAELARLVADGEVGRDMQRPYRDLDGVAGVSAAAAAALDPARVAPVLGVAPDGVAAALLGHGQTLASRPAVPDVLSSGAFTGTLGGSAASLVADAGRQVLGRLVAAVPAEPQREPARAFATLALLGALSAAGDDIGKKAADLAGQIRTHLDAPAPPPDHRLAEILVTTRGSTDAAVADAFVALNSDLVASDWPGTPARPPLALGPASLLAALRPAVTVTARIRARLGAALPAWLPPDWFDDLLVQPVMAAPVFTRPMYKALDAYSRDWLLPGLATFAQPDIVTVLTSNARFVEGFLTGLSHEMGRTLLWRGFPTDQRGTYFRRFWDAGHDELTEDIHRFGRTPLATHVLATLGDRVVLLVRGELIRRYPEAVVVAMLAGGRDADGHPVFEDPADNPGVKALAPILFHGHLEPDMVLVGFDLTIAEMTQAAAGDRGWWFLVAEHPTAPRFGLRETAGAGDLRDPLGWGDLAVRLAGPGPADRGFLDARTAKAVRDSDLPGADQAVYGANGASTAHVLLRDPVRAAFEGLTLLGPTGALNR